MISCKVYKEYELQNIGSNDVRSLSTGVTQLNSAEEYMDKLLNQMLNQKNEIESQAELPSAHGMYGNRRISGRTWTRIKQYMTVFGLFAGHVGGLLMARYCSFKYIPK